jgi:excisionase family DNA binding protein
MTPQRSFSVTAPQGALPNESEPKQERIHPKMLSINEACDYTGLGRTLICGFIKSGDLPARKAGRRTLILKADLDDWLDGLPPCAGATTNGPRPSSPTAAAVLEKV